VLKDQVAGSAVMISVIGPGWPDVCNEDGKPRLHQENDFVRFEIREATSRRIPVPPVLLDGNAGDRVKDIGVRVARTLTT
jgi:hypothetical protein